MTVTEVSKKLYTMAQVEETRDYLQKVHGDKKKKSELVLGVNTVRVVETSVCNNPNCDVTFTPARPAFYSCTKFFKSKKTRIQNLMNMKTRKRQSRIRRKSRSHNLRKANLKVC